MSRETDTGQKKKIDNLPNPLPRKEVELKNKKRRESVGGGRATIQGTQKKESPMTRSKREKRKRQKQDNWNPANQISKEEKRQKRRRNKKRKSGAFQLQNKN
ncbi:hypothetical protein GF358_00065 [Candidatus Woesearchaeota archaeon]|nr:hypothetical protein [Candidatus Woesearchaeota archaeon]